MITTRSVGAVDRDHADSAVFGVEGEDYRLGSQWARDHQRHRGDGLGTRVDGIDAGGRDIVGIDAGEHALDRGRMLFGAPSGGWIHEGLPSSGVYAT